MQLKNPVRTFTNLFSLPNRDRAPLVSRQLRPAVPHLPTTTSLPPPRLPTILASILPLRLPTRLLRRRSPTLPSRVACPLGLCPLGVEDDNDTLCRLSRQARQSYVVVAPPLLLLSRRRRKRQSHHRRRGTWSLGSKPRY